ncbi:hypothetical protein [Spirosoma endbachense]|uniref:Aminotransferase class I/II-fold pyridoxal phosphate-dependent enzyme n=1 Tax=Spirosoma endbachense TaxID=2666025 RepID=A0A6P1VNP4_9BACT|nr:hypothetical protein [Spirosoma endbachense]QHV93732.1 hypothetical protein GJR95_01200 [Spirosoma endbachense]
MTALAALTDSTFIPRVNQAITAERVKWHTFVNKLGISDPSSQVSFVCIDLQKPYVEVAARFTQHGIRVDRALPPYDTWIRVIIGISKENGKSQAVILQVCSAKSYMK